MKNLLIAFSFIALLITGCAKEEIQPKQATATSSENLLPVPSYINLTIYADEPNAYYAADSKIAIYDITGYTVDIFNPGYPPENGIILDKNTKAQVKAVYKGIDWTYSGLHAPNKRYLVYAKAVYNGKYSYSYFTIPEGKSAHLSFVYQWETKYSKPQYIQFH
jgi:hypothetical protein